MKKKKNIHAVMLGRLGGKKGGPARARALTPERRSYIARVAARARWEKEKLVPDSMKRVEVYHDSSRLDVQQEEG